MSKSAAAKKQKSNVKKKHQDEWDDLLKSIRLVSRELGLPIGAESNFVIKLFEEYAEDNAPFPPKQLIVGGRPMDTNLWVKVLIGALTSKQCAVYTSIFETKTYKGLRALCFWGCEVGDAGTQALCDSLPLLPLCTKLELMDCGLGVAACEHLSLHLRRRRYTHLKILRLDHNAGIASEGVARLSEGLYFNSLLTTLSLAYCNIKKEGGVFLQNIMATRDTGIKNLNLEGNSLEREGIMTLSKGLLNNCTLTSLNLSICHFGGDGDALPGELDAIKCLLLGVTACKSLKTLNLEGNLLGNAGVELLHQAALAGDIRHITELAVTPFVDSDIYKALVDQIEANKPVKTKKKKKGGKKKQK